MAGRRRLDAAGEVAVGRRPRRRCGGPPPGRVATRCPRRRARGRGAGDRAGVVPGHRSAAAPPTVSPIASSASWACSRGAPEREVPGLRHGVQRQQAGDHARRRPAAYASGVPTSSAGLSSPTLPRKPDIGGMPARFIAGTKNSTPSSGARRASPPSRISEVLPARRSTSPSDEEQRGLDGDVVGDVEDRAGDARRRSPARCRRSCSRCG